MASTCFNRQFVVTGSKFDNWNINISRKSCKICLNFNIFLKNAVVPSF